jgi:CDP-6-deoxy-D-xylo-4-hexulose-3-dehydrase
MGEEKAEDGTILMMRQDQVSAAIRDLLKTYFQENSETPKSSHVRISEPYFDFEEIGAVVDALLEGWLGVSRRAKQLERELAQYIQTSGARLTNSGSSADLLAVAALKHYFDLREGDEIITSALNFPTAVNAIIFNGLIPVLVDSAPGTYLVDYQQIEKVISAKTRGILVVHAVGNVANMDYIKEIADKHNLFVIEDACDALGASYRGQKVGGIGDVGTFSFYPAHQITTGEGGCVLFNNEAIGGILQSLRDWGRGDHGLGEIVQDTQQEKWRMRFGTSADPYLDWYDRKFVYENVGYNFKLTEFQAAIGLVQLNRLDEFVKVRARNFNYLLGALEDLQDLFLMPSNHPQASPSWLFFPLVIRDDAPFKRKALIEWLEERHIETRPVLAGNIVRQPAYKKVKIRVDVDLTNSDRIMQNSLCVGIHPRLNEYQLQHIVQAFHEFAKGN